MITYNYKYAEYKVLNLRNTHDVFFDNYFQQHSISWKFHLINSGIKAKTKQKLLK